MKDKGDNFHHLDCSNYWLHFHCYTLNVLADASFVLLQQDTWRKEYRLLAKVHLSEIVWMFQVQSSRQINNKKYLPYLPENIPEGDFEDTGNRCRVESELEQTVVGDGRQQNDSDGIWPHAQKAVTGCENNNNCLCLYFCHTRFALCAYLI